MSPGTRNEREVDVEGESKGDGTGRSMENVCT